MLDKLGSKKAMTSVWLTNNCEQSEVLYKGKECSGNEHAWGAPLDLRHPILISPTGTPEKEMANHCGILAWRISWTEERGGLQSM